MDSAWFETYFTNLTTRREFNIPGTYDSLEIVREISETKNYLPGLCRYHIEKAGWYIAGKKNDSAVSHFKMAIKIAEKANLVKESGNAYLGLANLYEFGGNTLEAAENYLKAIKLLKDKGRKRTLVGIYRNLYGILSRLRQKNSALQNIVSMAETNKSRESGLVKIINAHYNEDESRYLPDQSLVKEVGANGIYVIFGNAKFLVTGNTIGYYGSFRDIRRIPAGILSSIPDFPKNGSILMEIEGDPKVYLVNDSLLYHISNPEVLENYGGWDAVYYVPNGSLKKFPKSNQQVTAANVNTLFNLKQEFDNLADSIREELNKNNKLSNRLSQKIAARNNTLQRRKIFLWVSGIGLLTLSLIVSLLMHSFRQKKNQEALLRKTAIERERSRIATDMHDDLGAGLSKIRFLSETVQRNLSDETHKPYLQNIAGSSVELVDKFNEIIWAMNEKNNSLEDLLYYIRGYTAKYCEESSLEYKISIPENTPSIMINGEMRRHIFLTVKEVLHNVVKHAEASNVSLTIQLNSEICIYIHDDGKGFEMTATGQHGNGLRSMQQRIKNINGKLNIQNRAGTEIIISIPFPPV